MVFKVFNKKEIDKDIYFKLIEEPTGGVSLVVCNGQGETRFLGRILEITPDGGLFRYSGIAWNLGLKLDKDNKIKEQTYK